MSTVRPAGGVSERFAFLCADVLERVQQHPSSHRAAAEVQLPSDARGAEAAVVRRRTRLETSLN